VIQLEGHFSDYFSYLAHPCSDLVLGSSSLTAAEEAHSASSSSIVFLTFNFVVVLSFVFVS
jgi:hypothetical protein